MVPPGSWKIFVKPGKNVIFTFPKSFAYWWFYSGREYIATVITSQLHHEIHLLYN